MSQNGQNKGLNLTADEARALDLLRTRLTPLVNNIEQLQQAIIRDMNGPPNWPTLHRHSTLLKSHIRSLHEFLNQGFRRDQDTPTNGDVIGSLYPYPVTPFSSVQQGGLIATLTRKKLEVRDETWIDGAVKKAAEFCRISEQVDIGPPKAPSEPKDEDEYGGIKRIKTNMNEDEVEEIWRLGPDAHVTNEFFFAKVRNGGETSDDEDLDKIDRVREELGVELGETPPSTPDEGEGEQEVKKPEPPAQPPQEPALPLGMLLKFMSTGDADLQAAVHS